MSEMRRCPGGGFALKREVVKEWVRPQTIIRPEHEKCRLATQNFGVLGDDLPRERETA